MSLPAAVLEGARTAGDELPLTTTLQMARGRAPLVFRLEQALGRREQESSLDPLGRDATRS
jgi:hypothetical protein